MREYKRKTQRGSTPKFVMEKAVKQVLMQKRPCHKVGKEYGIPHVTLRRYCLKYRKEHSNQNDDIEEISLKRYGYFNNRSVFDSNQELLLVEYLLKSSTLYYGLSTSEVKSLAYEYATKVNLKIPSSWAVAKQAGSDWLSAFMKRHPSLSLRTPESTSLSRATSFNRHNVKTFYDRFASVLERDGFTPDKIWNVDETGCTTVQKPRKIVAATGAKQVGAIVSGERGQLVTLCCAVSATGNAIPPMFIFPRVHYKDHFIKNGAPTGSIGRAHPSGCMTAENFLVWMKHFVSHVRPTHEDKVLLLLYNHQSHISLEVIDYAKDRGIVLLSFPPHCSHKLQPLDRAVYGPFKRYYNSACDCWMKENRGTTMTIYDIPDMVGRSFPRAFTPVNIQSGFKVAGIYPFDSDIFTDVEFLPSDVTDRPIPINVADSASTQPTDQQATSQQHQISERGNPT
ncbi:uncharacterized protein LOC143449241 isoform X2 [Clavelina lepadiformis]|uniref:uncharacterized protein LOC143449241 isoform X2 n=1 Tax=Clavelina lepadiformis TaxID=159417 RepID=UPI0040415A0B